VREVSDQFLLNMAEVSGTLIGLFFVGVFFYVETGLRHLDPALRDVFVPYLRAGTRIVLLLFALPLGLSLTLVVLGPGWTGCSSCCSASRSWRRTWRPCFGSRR
jgi:hypothetical protein